MQQEQAIINNSKKYFFIIISIVGLIIAGIIAILILINQGIKKSKEAVSTSDIFTPPHLIEREGEIIPDYEYFIAYKLEPITEQNIMSTVVSEILTIDGRTITVYNKDGDPFEFYLSEDTQFFQFHKGDKENFFPASLEDLKVGSIISYYLPREERGFVGQMFIRIEE